MPRNYIGLPTTRVQALPTKQEPNGLTGKERAICRCQAAITAAEQRLAALRARLETLQASASTGDHR